MAGFWVNEDFPTNDAKIHRAECPYCVDGAGTQGVDRPTTAQWHPFDSYDAAHAGAAATGRRVTNCGHCQPAA